MPVAIPIVSPGRHVFFDFPMHYDNDCLDMIAKGFVHQVQ
jgi:hypothetical protein